MYDKNNIFAKILRSESSCDKVYEDDLVLFFNDLYPAAKIHVLGIPKIDCVDFSDFIKKADKNTISHFFEKTEEIIKKLGIAESGYRIFANSGVDGRQEIPHFHIHILGGEKVGRV